MPSELPSCLGCGRIFRGLPRWFLHSVQLLSMLPPHEVIYPQTYGVRLDQPLPTRQTSGFGRSMLRRRAIRAEGAGSCPNSNPVALGFRFRGGPPAGRLFDERRGTLAMEIIGGAYGSTAVTQSLAQCLRTAPAYRPEAAGIAAASAVMYLKMTILNAVLAPRLFLAFAQMVASAFVVAAIAISWLYRREAKGAEAVGRKAALALAASPAVLALGIAVGISRL